MNNLLVPECCICLESHYICKTSCGCLVELKDITCPLCRSTLTNLPPSIKKNILKNNKHLEQVLNDRILDIRDLNQFPHLDS